MRNTLIEDRVDVRWYSTRKGGQSVLEDPRTDYQLNPLPSSLGPLLLESGSSVLPSQSHFLWMQCMMSRSYRHFWIHSAVTLIRWWFLRNRWWHLHWFRIRPILSALHASVTLPLPLTFLIIKFCLYFSSGLTFSASPLHCADSGPSSSEPEVAFILST